MQGCLLTFFTQQNCRHRGSSLAHWLVEEARSLGVRGATLMTANEGFGHHKRIHSAHFFELADQPLEVVMVVTAEEADRMFSRLADEKVEIFYCRTPVRFGTTGKDG